MPVFNGNFQQNLVCILLSFMLLMCIIYSMEMSDTMVIPFCSTLLLHKMMNLKITNFFLFCKQSFIGDPVQQGEVRTNNRFLCLLIP